MATSGLLSSIPFRLPTLVCLGRVRQSVSDSESLSARFHTARHCIGSVSKPTVHLTVSDYRLIAWGGQTVIVGLGGITPSSPISGLNTAVRRSSVWMRKSQTGSCGVDCPRVIGFIRRVKTRIFSALIHTHSLICDRRIKTPHKIIVTGGHQVTIIMLSTLATTVVFDSTVTDNP